MDSNSDLPSYGKIFGALNLKKGDAARSVLSPAAYLADLLQLLDDNLAVGTKAQAAGLHQRRADIKNLLLGSEHTYTSIPYLDIVNGILEQKVKGDTYKTIKGENYPFHLPFNFENERIKKFLHYLNISSEELYKLFSPTLDPELIGRESLKLSIEEYESILQSADKNTLKIYFGKIYFGETPPSEPFKVAAFLKITGLSELELRELLYQELSGTAKDSTTKTERTKASDFFVNDDLNGYATLDAAEEAIVWSTSVGSTSAIPQDWFDRVQRLIRLKQKIGFSFTELDLILRSCCKNRLDEQAMQTIAVVQQLRDRYEITIDVTCSFFSPINVLGIGDDPEPKDLFNRVFNGTVAHIDKQYIPGSYFVLPNYAEYAPLACLDDILSLNNKEYRKRVHQALNISDSQLTFIINKFREQAKIAGIGPSLLDSQTAIGLPALSLLFRMTQLAEMLDLSHEDLFNLFDILGKDPAIRTHSHFNLLIQNAIQEQDCYKIIAGGDVQASLWLVQVLCAISQWIQAHDLTTGELKQWLTGIYKDETEAATSRQQKIVFLNNLYQQFKPVMFHADLFESEECDRRVARIIYQTFIEKGSRLVASHDRRLVNYDPTATEKAVYQSLTRLQTISPEDFTALGLESKMLDKIFNNLILKDYISPEGTLLEAQFPLKVEQFQLETDFSAHREDLFMVIHDLLMEAMDAEGDETLSDRDDETSEMLPLVELSVYPSDLDILTTLSAKERDELYDNLIFNGYIDEDGTVLQTDFFIAEENVDAFEVGTGLTIYVTQIFKLIVSQTQRFNQEELILEKDVFAELPLKAFEIDNLIENLKFNEYINQKQVLINKEALLTATPETFNLALAFYPHRRQILRAIQAFVREFKAGFYTIHKDLFAEIADEIVAKQIYQQIEPDYLRNGQLQEDAEIFFLDSDNLESFTLGDYFTANDAAIVFNTLQTIITTAKKYQFTPQVLEELNFDVDEQEELIDTLEATGFLYDRTKLAWEKVSYFLRIDNALEFTLAGFEDYNKDIFFALHAIAKTIDADVREIAARFQALAEAQSNVLLEVLQDHFGVEADIIQILCQQVLQHPVSIVEEFLVPTLSVVDRHDAITVEPDHNKFNFAYRRIGQFAAIAAKLGLNQAETAIVWQDQDLVEKFPEKLVLPPGLDRFDALLDNGQGVLYLFKDNQYWTYSAESYNLLPPEGQPLATPKAQSLATLSEQFAGLTKIDAAFADRSGNLILIAQGVTYRKAKGSDRWVPQAKAWGKVANNFQDPQRVDATFQDQDGRAYLFSGDQYIRYSGNNYDTVDEGYPLKIERHWRQDALTVDLPPAFQRSIDASFQDITGKTYLFKDKSYLCLETSEPEKPIRETWGKVRNNFETLEKIDAAYTDGHEVVLFSGDQLVMYQDSLENPHVTLKEGFPKRLRNQYANLPAAFVDGVEAAFKGADERLYLFKAGTVIRFSADLSRFEETPIRETWGRVHNTLQQEGRVDTAFVGLDGKTYLFSGDQYVRYSGVDYAHVDEGFPRTIEQDWGGLNQVQAAFIFDGKTYLFGRGKESDGTVYVRYSTHDYTTLDVGYPKPPNDNWWNLPLSLVEEDADFETIDAVFNAPDNRIYLFSRGKFIYFDQQQRWWSEPQELATQWDSIPFQVTNYDLDLLSAAAGKTLPEKGKRLIAIAQEDGKTLRVRIFDHRGTMAIDVKETALKKAKSKQLKELKTLLEPHWQSNPLPISTAVKERIIDTVTSITGYTSGYTPSVDAAFTGKDGKTYLFSGTEYIKYSGQDYSRADDRYPNITTRYWGQVANNIAKTGRVDAVLVVESHETIEGHEETTVYTYLFSGNQYFRYRGNQYTEVEEGYPKYIATSLKQEPRFKNLNTSACDDGIDAAFADQRQLYLFKGGQCYVISDALYKPYGDLGLGTVSCAFMDEGTIFLAEDGVWQRHSSLEGQTTHKTPILPPRLRAVPDSFQSGIQAVLHGRDRNTYLFKGPNCFNVSLNKAYPLSEEWGRVKNNIDIHNTVDAAFVGRDGKTYLFSGDQYVVYAADSLVDGKSVYGDIEQLPRSIKAYWGGLTRVALAFVKDEKTYLFEPADDEGNARYVCYSTADYSQPDTGFPQVGDRDFWQIPTDYTDDDFLTIAAVLFEGKNMFLLSGKRYIQFDAETEQWTYPKPLSRIWRGIPFNDDSFQRIKTAFTGRDGRTYFFSDEQSVTYDPALITNQYTLPASINTRWGRVRNNFVNHPKGNRVDAAVVFQDKITYLFSGDQYVRYSSQDYRYVDAGYPQTIANHLRTEAGFQTLPETFEDTLATLMTAGAERIISAILANDRTLYLLVGKQWHVVSQSLTATYLLSRLGHLKNNLVQRHTVDAALFQANSGQTFLFSGDQGVRYSDDTYTYVDDGYPKALTTILTQELGMTNLTEAFQYGIDAVLQGKDGTLYVFKDKQYQQSNESEPKPIAAYWGKLKNNFEVTATNAALDAAFISPEGKLYVFKGDQYIRYTNPEQNYVDEGFPKLIKDNWGNLPVEFEAAIAGGFVFEGKTYLLKGEDYVRYSKPTYQLIDSIFPQKIKYRWGNWSDYLLNDLYVITRFKQLQDTYGNGEHTLIDFLNPETGTVTDPYQLLAEIFVWDLDEVKWLKRKNAFLTADTLFEIQFKLETILRFFDIFTLAQKMGSSPSELYKAVWLKRYAPNAEEVHLKDVADTLYRFLALIHRS